ncbi:MAG: Fic family protein [Sulfurospirillum sp.]|nr:Fic family protein [Sulfurospirillum sp.]
MNSYKPPYTITSKMVNLISSISEELTKIEYSKKEIITPRLRKKNRVKTLAGTLEIEGNFMGEERITAMLEGKPVLGTMIEVAEARGAIEVYKKLEKYIPYSLDSLLDAHKILMSEILSSAGKLRAVNVQVGSHIAPPHEVVSNLMQDLFGWLENSDEHPLIKSCVFHYEFEFIHPFSDGNGRIGRLWQSVILYHWREVFSAIPTESIVRDYQQKYYKALEDATTNGESTVFVEFMLEVILETIRKQILKDKKNVPLNVPKNVPLNVPLKRLDNIMKIIKKDKDITMAQIADKLGVTDKTIKRDIVKLKEENRLKRAGSLKAGHWEIVDEI